MLRWRWGTWLRIVATNQLHQIRWLCLQMIDSGYAASMCQRRFSFSTRTRSVKPDLWGLKSEDWRRREWGCEDWSVKTEKNQRREWETKVAKCEWRLCVCVLYMCVVGVCVCLVCREGSVSLCVSACVFNQNADFVFYFFFLSQTWSDRG